jgi:hypothetical protein
MRHNASVTKSEQVNSPHSRRFLITKVVIAAFGNWEYRMAEQIANVVILLRKRNEIWNHVRMLDQPPSAEETTTLSEELATLSKQQFMARQSSIYIGMTPPEAADYNARRNRIAEIYGILGKFKALSLSHWVITPYCHP